MLVYVRPSNEALLRARAPGAQDQHRCPSIPLSCVFREQEDGQVVLYCAHRMTRTLQMTLPSLLVSLSQEWHPCWFDCGSRASTF
jgi:hypothetical protein